jgi:hypothetical protein
MVAAGGTGDLRWREARRWRRGFALALAACAAALLANAAFSDVRPASAWGLAYGTAAALLLLGVALFAARRRSMRLSTRLGLGRARSWLYFHVYGGTLFLVLVALHTGFRLPEGGLAWLLWGLALWTVGTGFLGLGLQQWIPKALGSGLGVEVHYDRIPALVAELRARADAIAAAASEPVQRVYARKVAPELHGPVRRWIYFVDITGRIQSRLGEFEYLRQRLPAEERGRVAELEGLFRTKLEMDAHYTLQRALRAWLLLHVPTSLVLVALVAAHVFTVLYY